MTDFIHTMNILAFLVEKVIRQLIKDMSLQGRYFQ